MQGFNKYYPPDYDGEKHGSLNSYRGKHALGDRARKLDQGILITRFELPFNIWCDTCNNHIGMGVRYNAEKKKVGMYYTTAIFSFRCKCHLCDGWFEIQTDPKNTRYVVVSGARKKDEDWNPEENGGYAVHDTEASSSTVDPLAALEKTTSAETHLAKVQIPRLDELQTVSERFNADPYALSSKVRKQFREVKKVETAKRKADDLVKERYGLPSSLPLLEDDPDAAREAKELWEKEQASRHVKKAKMVPSTVPIMPKQPPGKNTAASSLRARVLGNTAKLQPRR